MNLFEFKLEVMTPNELEETIASLKGRLNSNPRDKKEISKMISMAEEKLENHKLA